MGEVYRARDTRLDRTVALKVLPAHLSNDLELRRRFEREARAISALSHPNICTLYDIGNVDGQEYLVMEFLEGETLAERLSRGHLPVDDVIRFGTDIADALEKAHRQGIIHRDLKPGNIVITHSGGAKLLDFGLAKWMPADEHSLLGRADDITKPLTTQGTLLGTVPYMSPEQLEGKDVDARSDIFSFGAILYEMATGVRAFNATSNASLIASILREDPPPPSRLRNITPRALDQIIRTCLSKNPNDRFQSAHDVKLALQMLRATDADDTLDTTKQRPWLLPAIIAGLVLVVMALAAWALSRRSDEKPRVYRFTIAPPHGSAFPSLGEGGAFALSRDGRQLVFEATTPDGRTYLWLRALDSESAQMLEATEGGEYPFWSPDGKSIAFFADGKLKRMSLPDGPSQTIADAPTGRGGSWSNGDVIVFAPASAGPLYRVAASGGQPPQPVTAISKDAYSHRWPQFVDDTRFVYVVQSQLPAVRGVYGGSLESREAKRLLAQPLSVAFSAPDQLFYVRDHVLVQQRLDVREMQLAEDATTITDRMIYYFDRAYVPVTAADDGTIAFRRDAASNMRVISFARDGRRVAAVGEMGEYEGVSLSPDGTRVAFGYFDANESLNHVAIATRGGVPRRFTFARGNQYSPIWSPDGARLAFSDDQAGVDTLAAKPLAGTSNEQPLIPVPPSSTYAQSWSPDGEWILYRVQDAKTGFDVWALSLKSGKSAPYLHGPADESQAQFSPDGKWVAYGSTESGQPEVYVQPFPATGAKWQVSVGGGEQPRWRRDGKELYFIAVNRNLMAVPITVPGAFDAEAPRVLFPTNIPFGDLNVSQAYDVAPDGSHFTIAGPDPATPQSPISVIAR